MQFGFKIALIFLLSTQLSFCEECPLPPAYATYIENNLSPFKDGITQSMIDKAKQAEYTCTYTIKNKQVLTNCPHFMQLWSRCFVGSIASDLPDLEFVINYQDQPRVIKHNTCSITSPDWSSGCYCDSDFKRPQHSFFMGQGLRIPLYENVPIFSAATIPQCFNDILVPSILHIRQLNKIHFLKPNSMKWQDKQFKAFWRGGPNGGEFASLNEPIYQYHRPKLVLLCQKIKDCDAHISFYNPNVPQQVSKSLQAKLGKASYIKFRKQVQYKILIDIDGNSYSERFPKYLKSGSAVFKIHAFDDIGIIAAKAWHHYVPIKMDLSDFEQKLEWARSHDRQLQKMTERAQKFVEETYTTEIYECYMKRVLLGYHALIVKGRIMTSLQQESNIQTN